MRLKAAEALKKALEWDASIPLGIIYRVDKPSFGEYLPQLENAVPLVKRKWAPQDAEPFMKEFY
ncbi:hypothetical protein [Lutispora sp.]|uniref:hypothetical protein n=1 Tax=Lutispora sp. TaxID=2828727 RepID=UPI002B210FC5|nr:hypothetical protein [Lutispora sp.]MEA4961716.1 hypothetical protein [Lutispora sp.]